MGTFRPRVLIVDDEPRNIRLLEGILYSEPYELITARSGQEALALCEQMLPDVILLDIRMPGMNGLEVCQQLKSNDRYRMIPVVMVTALTNIEDRVKATEAGADDFLSKPVDANELIVRVRSLVRVRLLYLEKERAINERLRFMAGVAHDIRSPLNSLILNLDRMAKRLAAEDEWMKKTHGRIASAAEHIRMLAMDIMNYYQIETGQFQLKYSQCQLSEIIDAVAAIALPLAEEKGVYLEILPAPSLLFDADRSAIAQVLLNLLTNAIRYTDSGGQVILRLYDLSVSEYTLPAVHYPPVLALPLSGVLIEVKDTGRGIAPEDYVRIFKEFERADADGSDKTEGVGLGLPVSQRLIRLHSGELWFHSQIGQGSTFAFFIPLQAR